MDVLKQCGIPSSRPWVWCGDFNHQLSQGPFSTLALTCQGTPIQGLHGTPTRWEGQQTIDHIYSNNTELAQDFHTLNLKISDHAPLSFQLRQAWYEETHRYVFPPRGHCSVPKTWTSINGHNNSSTLGTNQLRLYSSQTAATKKRIFRWTKNGISSSQPSKKSFPPLKGNSGMTTPIKAIRGKRKETLRLPNKSPKEFAGNRVPCNQVNGLTSWAELRHSAGNAQQTQVLLKLRNTKCFSDAWVKDTHTSLATLSGAQSPRDWKYRQNLKKIETLERKDEQWLVLQSGLGETSQFRWDTGCLQKWAKALSGFWNHESH